MAVYVLDKHHKPLDACTEKRAKQLLKKKRARIHRMYPFTIRIVDRTVEESIVHPVRCKIDPGSKVTGIALVRENKEKQVVISLIELHHRGAAIHENLISRSSYRKRRRSSNLRYRAPRFDNRTRKKGWIAPSLLHRVETVQSWVHRLCRWAPVTSISCETVRFDTQKLNNPEIQGIEYQQGTLFGYEVREYLLEKWGRECAYCRKKNVPLQIDHIRPRSLGGSDRIDNLTLACPDCNLKKGNSSIEDFAPKCAQHILKKTSLKDAAAVNSTRSALLQTLIKTSLPCESGTGGQTKYNRVRMGIPKTHSLDAACVGDVTSLENWAIPAQQISCTGRGAYQRTRLDRFGFSRGTLAKQKHVHGFRTGDRVVAEVPRGKKAGRHIGRVAIRSSGSFNIQTSEGVVQGINWKHCRTTQRSDGYHYVGLLKGFNSEHLQKRRKSSASSPP